MKMALLALVLIMYGPLSLAAYANVGYRGLLYSHDNDKVPKYAGAFGTGFTVNRPQAIFHSDSNKTFFTFTSNLGSRETDGMAYQVSCFNHTTKALCKEGPKVFLRRALVDAHDNPAILIDDAGFIWLYASGRGRECAKKKIRCGEIYRSARPANIQRFFKVESHRDFAYAQPWLTDAGKVLLYTRYSDRGHRQIWVRKTDRQDYLLVTGGHYFVSVAEGNNLHVAYSSLLQKEGGRQWDADLRTNLYYIFSNDAGKTWQTSGCRTMPINCDTFSGLVEGGSTKPNTTIRSDQPSARILKTLGQAKTYIQDIRLSDAQEVLILFTQSKDHQPVQAERALKMSRLGDHAWHFRQVDNLPSLVTTHNYSNGFIAANGDVVFPISNANPSLSKNFSGGELVRFKYDNATQFYDRYSRVFHNDYRHNNNIKDVYNKTEESAKDFSFFWGDSPVYSGIDYSGKSYLFFANEDLKVTKMTP